MEFVLERSYGPSANMGVFPKPGPAWVLLSPKPLAVHPHRPFSVGRDGSLGTDITFGGSIILSTPGFGVISHLSGMPWQPLRR